MPEERLEKSFVASDLSGLPVYDQFAAALQRDIPPDARLLMFQFRGDPDEAANWSAKTYQPHFIDQRANVYLCVSAMRRAADGRWRRGKDNFAGGLCLMLDDVGGGIGSLKGMEALKGLEPSCLIETSKGNHQAIFIFDRLFDDRDRMELLIDGVISAAFDRGNAGMKGVNRVFRAPTGVNGKAKHRDADGRLWSVRAAHWNPGLRFDPLMLADHFGVSLKPRPAFVPKAPQTSLVVELRKQMWLDVMERARRAGMFRNRKHLRPEQWIYVDCPWVEYHSGGRNDDGAAVSAPKPENEWWGGFHCHHHHKGLEGFPLDDEGHPVLKWRDFARAIMGSDDEVAADLAAQNMLTDEQNRMWMGMLS